MTTTTRTQRVLDALSRAWGHGEADALDEILSPAFVRHGRTSRMSREALKASLLEMRRAFPDLSMTVDSYVEGGDSLALRWSSTGTLRDTYLGLPPTGRTYSVSGATFSRFEGDEIIEETVVYDRRGEYRSLGMRLASDPESSGTESSHGVEPAALRNVHRKLATGVTVVTTQTGEEPRGLAVNAFSSVSLEPPLILICVQKNSSTYSHLSAATHFGVNILSAHQVDVANVFATKQDRKFDKIAWHIGTHGVPLVDDACAYMEVKLQDTLHASTHSIFIGKVVDTGWTEFPPLIYTDGQFFNGADLMPIHDGD